MKRTLLLLTAFLVLLGAGCTESQESVTPVVVDDEVAVMETDKGTIILEFYPDLAPNHVARIKELVREEFYDGILFHRVIPGFVIQAGDPQTKDADFPRERMGTGGSGQTIDAEFNDRPHIRGTWSMARAQAPNSGDSQFFICLGTLPSLDGEYTVFGQVISGIGVVDDIVNAPRDQRDNPDEPIKIVNMTIRDRMSDE